MNKTEIIKKALENSMSYSEYRDMVDRMLEAGKTTGGSEDADMIEYTEMNVARMNKWDKHYELETDLKDLLNNLEHTETWVVLTEGWCGDAAHSVPMLAKMAEATGKIDLRIVLRDENPELMDQYLTNGGRSIPKLVRIDKDFKELGTWGPRPKEVQDLFNQLKQDGESKDEIMKAVQTFYGRDRGKAIQKEFGVKLAMAE